MARDRGQVVPWTLRLADAAPLPPAGLGLGIAAAAFLAPVLLARWKGFALWGTPQLWIEALYASLIGYVAVAPVYAVRGGERDLRALRPVLTCSDGEFRRHLDRVRSFARMPLRVTDLLGLALGVWAAT